MICDDCTKKDVCKHTEQCQSLERNYAGITMDSIFHITVSCDKRAAYPTQPKGGIGISYPDSVGSGGPGGVWTSEGAIPTARKITL